MDRSNTNENGVAYLRKSLETSIRGLEDGLVSLQKKMESPVQSLQEQTDQLRMDLEELGKGNNSSNHEQVLCFDELFERMAKCEEGLSALQKSLEPSVHRMEADIEQVRSGLEELQPGNNSHNDDNGPLMIELLERTVKGENGMAAMGRSLEDGLLSVKDLEEQVKRLHGHFDSSSQVDHGPRITEIQDGLSVLKERLEPNVVVLDEQIQSLKGDFEALSERKHGSEENHQQITTLLARVANSEAQFDQVNSHVENLARAHSEHEQAKAAFSDKLEQLRADLVMLTNRAEAAEQ